MLAWDRSTGTPLSPAIVWQDRRSGVCARLADRAAELAAITGLPLDPYFAAPKMTWLRENLTADGTVTTTDTWLLHRLGAQYVTDAATASRTMLLDLDSAAWSEPACAAFGLDPAALPAVADCAGIVGETPLFGSVGPALPIAGIAVDQQAALLAEGCLAAGDAKCTYGTGAFLLVTTGSSADIAALSGRHAARHIAATLGAGLAAGLGAGGARRPDAAAGAEWGAGRMPVRVEAPLRWISPNAIGSWAPPPLGRFVLRSREFRGRVRLEVRQEDRLLARSGLVRLVPGRPVHLGAGWLARVDPAGGPVRITTGSRPDGRELRFLSGSASREAPVTTGPEEHRTAAAAAARRRQLRASQADREDAIEALKVAYVQGRLTEEELEARVGQAFASRTHADLAAITADIPAGPAAGRRGPDAGPGGRRGHRGDHRGRRPRRRGAHRRCRADPVGDHHGRGPALHRERAAQRTAGTRPAGGGSRGVRCRAARPSSGGRARRNGHEPTTTPCVAT